MVLPSSVGESVAANLTVCCRPLRGVHRAAPVFCVEGGGDVVSATPSHSPDHAVVGKGETISVARRLGRMVASVVIYSALFGGFSLR